MNSTSELSGQKGHDCGWELLLKSTSRATSWTGAGGRAPGLPRTMEAICSATQAENIAALHSSSAAQMTPGSGLAAGRSPGTSGASAVVRRWIPSSKTLLVA